MLFVLPLAPLLLSALVVDPVVVDTAEDAAATVTLKASDPAAGFSLAKKPKRGTVVLDEKTGALTFTPDRNWSGNDEVAVTVRAGKEKTRVTVPITVRAVNDLPVIAAMTLNTREDTATRLGLTVNDVDNDKFTFSIGTQGALGTASVDERGRVSYAPNKDKNGKDRVVVVVDDGAGGKVDAVVDVVVAAVNDAPVVNKVDLVGDEDAAASVVVVATDVDGDALAYSVGKGAKNGTANIDDKGNLSFSPNKNWHGTDAIVVIVKDGNSSTSIDVSITTKAVNDAPVAEAATLGTREEQPIAMALTVQDVDGDKPTFSLGGDGKKGKASVDGKGRVSYAPNKDENGSDSFVVVVDDGHGAKVDAVVNVVVAAVNDAPVLFGSQKGGAEFKGDEDGVVEGTVVASDVDGDVLACTITAPPAHGAAVVDVQTGKLRFTPKPDWNGSDQLTVTVKDGTTSSSASIKLIVAAVNDAPVVDVMTLNTQEEEPVALTLTVRDVDGDKPTFSIGSDGKKGKASVDGKGRVSYAPNKDENGSDSFVVVVDDGHGAKVDAVVNVVVAPVNDAPVFTAAEFKGDEDGVVEASVVASDVDGDVLVYAVATQPQNATATIDAKSGKLSLAPKKNWHGKDAVVVVVKDGTTQTTATLPITLAPVNDPPVIEAMTLNTREEEPVSLTLTVRDVDGDPITFAMGGKPARGTANVDGKGRVTYVPAKDENGKDGFYVVVKDGTASVDAPVEVVVAPVNDAPKAVDASVAVAEDNVLNGSFAGTDVDGDALSFTVVKPPQGRFEASKQGAFSWTPPKDFHGADTVVFDVDDGRLRGRGQLALTVTPENDAPRLAVRSLSTREDKAGLSLASASDVDGDGLKFRVATQGAKGDAVVAANGAIAYTPKADENGDDVVVIAVDDGTTSTEQSMKVTIAPEPDAPRIVKKTWQLQEDTVEKTTLPGIDVDGDALVFNLVGADGGAKRGAVRLIDAKRGLVEYTPKLDENGVDELRFEVSDAVTKVAGVFAVAVAAVNDAPTAEPLSLSTTEDKQVRGQLVIKDVDGDALKIALASAPKNATVKIDGGNKNTFTVEPNKDFNGELAFTMIADEVQPNGLHGKPVEVKVSVAPENDAPVAAAQSLSTTEDAPLPLQLLATDVDKDALSYRITVQPQLGAVELDEKTGKATYTPRKNTYGNDFFYFVVSDGHVDAKARVVVDVAAVDDAPIAVAGSLISPRAGRITGKLLGRDPEGASLTFKIVTQPSIGRVTLLDSKTGAYAYTAEGGNKSGRTQFTFVVEDGGQVSQPGTVLIDVQ